MDTLTSLIRDAFCASPIPESGIAIGDAILYAQIQPIGIITVGMGTVDQIIDGVLENQVRAFRCVMPDGTTGCYSMALDNTLTIIPPAIVDSGIIYDTEAAIGSDEPLAATYSGRTLSMGTGSMHFEDPSKDAEGITVTEYVPGITLYVRAGAGKLRLFPPGSRLVIDRNTLSFWTDGNLWGITQAIPDGPEGSFVLPGYRIIAPEDYTLLCEAADHHLADSG